ncbi:MAG: response regulator [Deltaproteobacteria bacterium]|nr:response regulator [Deltaproteobacteria bacterium]NIS77634.1 response regulator [Deltaproteobacteria bacterium]
MGRRVLVIEDDRDIARLLTVHLEDIGCDVSVAHDGREGLEKAATGAYDLIVLDIMLPGIDGIELCRNLREKRDYTPILMLTAKSSELDRVLGLELGADDYLTKPFSIRELQARVKALFRRMEAMKSREPVPAEDVITRGGLVIDTGKREVTRNKEKLTLTAKEFDLLLYFARTPGRVYTRSQLLDTVWGYGHEGYEHTVNSHINRLRGKVEADPSRPEYILTVWGVGYKFRDENG